MFVPQVLEAIAQFKRAFPGVKPLHVVAPDNDDPARPRVVVGGVHQRGGFIRSLQVVCVFHRDSEKACIVDPQEYEWVPAGAPTVKVVTEQPEALPPPTKKGRTLTTTNGQI